MPGPPWALPVCLTGSSQLVRVYLVIPVLLMGKLKRGEVNQLLTSRDYIHLGLDLRGKRKKGMHFGQGFYHLCPDVISKRHPKAQQSKRDAKL